MSLFCCTRENNIRETSARVSVIEPPPLFTFQPATENPQKFARVAEETIHRETKKVQSWIKTGAQGQWNSLIDALAKARSSCSQFPETFGAPRIENSFTILNGSSHPIVQQMPIKLIQYFAAASESQEYKIRSETFAAEHNSKALNTNFRSIFHARMHDLDEFSDYIDGDMSAFERTPSTDQALEEAWRKQPTYLRSMLWKFRNTIGHSFSLETEPSTRIIAWIVCTLHLEIGQDRLPMAQHLMPIGRHLGKARVGNYVIHQDSLLIANTMRHCGKIFDTIISMQGRLRPEELIEGVGLLLYAFALAMPYTRGSGAIGEWLEAVIYRAHGYPSFTKDDAMRFDIIAMVAIEGIAEFMDHYKTNRTPRLSSNPLQYPLI